MDITGKELSISFWVKPYEINQPNTFISKGKHQYGVIMSSKDSVEFYINTNNLDETLLSPYYDNTAVRFSAKAPIDENWYGNWHQLFASYNGSELKLYIDNELRAEKKCNKNISHSPFPLCIGREAESQDQGEHSGRMSSMVIDQLRIFNKAIAPGEIEINTKNLVLSMDFENDQKEGMFYAVGLGGRTYGIIWPDRSIQPEIHQIKKSAQPVKVEEIDLEKGLFKIINRHHFMNLNEYTCSWDIQSEGKMIKKGEMEIDLPALKESELSIPYNYPEYSASKKEHILTISFHLKKSTEWENAGYEIAWDQFVFPGKSYPVEEKELSSRIEIEEDDSYISLKGEEFQYQFDKSKGNFSRFIFKGKTYFENGPVFNIWRAPLANDTDPWGSYIFNKKLKTDGLGRSTDNQLRSLGLKDPVVQVDKISAYQAGKDKVIVTIHLYSNSGNNRCSIERIEKYVIYSDGRIDMIQKIIPHNVMPDLFPRAGLQFEMDKSFREVEWYGRGPFETYPDRKTGAKIGIYNSEVDKEYVPYIIPQDYGNHTDVRWLKLEDGEGKGLFISSPDLLNFSFQKYSTDNLSRAMYTYQLKEAPYNTLNIDFEVSGVGGTAIRQLEKYQVKPGVKEYRMIITPY